MQENIIYPQQSDMGNGKGEYIFSNMTLRQVLDWFKQNLHDWGTITIQFNNGDVLRKFDYDLYNNSQFYHHLSWEYSLLVEKIEFYYCFMNKDIIIYLNNKSNQ